ncbi:hypothetical protein GCG54_00003579 [Colletotrichum gloeosporioides]|uniref:Invertebrate defensins family profile domain-containing protein n=1 Tax=Colletotrichum gloeosporioides TaxID=474922 RepID=A0A8H4CB58_COLGL|nr:uncharacterized protein GCG54_00003579 [Colletotrichum gloeosporioides]KAF3800680.1 hypothetical protein GCG54_00003579 [Colletotrichum gloeosporioides]
MRSSALLLFITSPLAVLAWTGQVYTTQTQCQAECPAACSSQDGAYDGCSGPGVAQSNVYCNCK